MRRILETNAVTTLLALATVLWLCAPCYSGEPDGKQPAGVIARTASNSFALNLHQELVRSSNDSPNLIYSPYSISVALTMAYAGAKGQTAAQMAKTLCFESEQFKIHSAFADLDRRIAGSQGSCELSVANAMWLQTGFEVLPPFKQTITKSYGGGMGRLDFVGNPTVAAQTINSWVNRQTRGKIPDIVDASNFSDWTQFVLANAIYFRGLWRSAFEVADTYPRAFWLSRRNSANVEMMDQTNTFRYSASRSTQFLEMPYRGGRVSMVVLLPRAVDGLARLEAKLSRELLSQFLRAARPVEVRVLFPKFRLERQFSLGGTLSGMGMADAFDQNRADFSGIHSSLPLPLYIQAVVHKALIEVDEKGTVAAAATALDCEFGGEPETPRIPVFNANRPFLFLIRHVPTGTILFMGRMVNPTL